MSLKLTIRTSYNNHCYFTTDQKKLFSSTVCFLFLKPFVHRLNVNCNLYRFAGIYEIFVLIVETNPRIRIHLKAIYGVVIYGSCLENPAGQMSHG